MKVLALFSGGLDSTLAVKMMTEQGLEVLALNFVSPFCCCDRTKGCSSGIKTKADKLGVEFKSIYLGREYLDIVKNPKHGYGRNLNPCIDCRILKFKKAKEVMNEVGASFIISGEVLGQRPMSQHRQALNLIDKESGLEGIVLRPLSAKYFPTTIAEEKGWVKRDKLLNITGRGRRPQIELAASFGIKDYACPAGGCLLTDDSFSKRVKDLFSFDQDSLDNAKLLRLGRHFRLSPEFKFVVGRNEQENSQILQFARAGDLSFEPMDLPGPSGLGKGKINKKMKSLAAGIIARYTSAENKVKVNCQRIGRGKQEVISVQALDQGELMKVMIA